MNQVTIVGADWTKEEVIVTLSDGRVFRRTVAQLQSLNPALLASDKWEPNQKDLDSVTAGLDSVRAI